MLNDFVYQYHRKKKMFDLKERHISMNSELFNKNSLQMVFFSVHCCNNLTIGYNFSNVHIVKHMKLKTLVTSLALQQIKEVGATSDRKISYQI